MPKLVAFLRAINVGGHNIKMTELCAVFMALGLKDVESFIASGNVIFTAPPKGAAALGQQLETRLAATLGYDVTTFLRTASEVAAVAQYRPFKKTQLDTAAALNVAFLAKPLDVAAAKTVTALKTEFDDFHVHGREVYWLCKSKQSDSKFSNAVFERALKVRATWRGVRTVEKLAAKYEFTV